MVLNKIVKSAAIIVKNTAGPCPIPNQRIAKGIHAIGGIGRKKLKNGKRKFREVRFSAIQKPKGIATMLASPKPIPTLIRLTVIFWKSSPLFNISKKLKNIFEGAGRIKILISP
jgi:hypothetical protein